MGTPLYDPKLSGAKFKNWIKAGLGVLFTKEGIEPFVHDEIKQFQQRCLSDICNNNGLVAGTTCSSCCTENVVVCPLDRKCNASRGICNFHRNSATQYLPLGCPNNICHNFKSKIQHAHRYFGPSYKNTDATKWCSNPWEVAKCFMPPDGYKDATNKAETDFNGIISVIMNHKAFQTKIHDDLSKTSNIFEQGREVCKTVRHSPQLEIEDIDLQQYFSVLQNLLSDPAYLSANTDAQNAKTKLLQLQSDTLVIGKDDVRKVLDDVGKAVQDEIRTEKFDFKKDAEKQKLKLIKMTKRYVSAIGKHGKMSVSQLDEAYRSAIDEIEKQRKKVVKEVQAEGEKQKKIIEAKGRAISKKIIIAVQTKADIVKRKMRKQFNQEVKRLKTEANANVIMIPSEAGKAVKEIKEAIDTGVKEIGADPVIMLSSAVTRMEQLNDCAEALKHTEKSKTESEKDTYNKLKKELKDDLATFYKTRYSTIPLSPLVEGHDTPLANFYILPEMNFLEKQDKKPAGEETKTPVKSLSDVFQSENSCEIYLTADAGFGKTAFSKYLAVTWCQAHCPERKYKTYFSVDAINAMRDFEFLFLVLLRDSSDDCSIDDLIMNQIIQNLSLLSSEMTMHSLQRILHREKSLIILDGLDEWTHPKKKCTKVPKTIPHRNAREKCVILTTTRPWKLGVLNLKTSEIDKKVELVKLTSESAQTLEERAISKIKNLDVAEAKILAKQLNENIKKNKLEDLESVPLLSMYLICLWCEDIPLGQSKCGLYASIIELLLSRTKSKHPAMEPTCEPSQSDIPQCFSEHEHCNQYCTYLKALGKLAFETLFSETKESTLVFTKSIVDKYLSPNDFKLSLDLGILTQSTERTLIKQISKVSFSHSTMHTFYCALYASFQNENDIKDIVLKTCKSLQSILDMSTLFVFISGMNTDIMSSISHEFLSVINVDKRTSEYRSHLEYEQYAKHPLKDIQDMYISCMKENTSDKELKLFCQDFFFSGDCKEEKYFSQLTRLMVHNKNNLESININTWLDGISLCTIIDSCALRELFQMNKIFYVGQGEEEQLPVLLNRSPKCVTVRSPRLSGSCSREMWETLQNNSLLQAICISGFAMSHDILNDFLNYIINRKTMTEIRLCYLSCIEHKRSCAFSLDFSQHSDLRKLELAEIPEVSQLKINSQVKHLELEEIKLGEKSLPPEMKNIESVDLQSVIMSASTLYDLVEVLKKLLHKVTVKIVGGKIKPTPEFKALKQYIHSSQNFRVMKDEGWGKFVFETKVES